MLGAIAAYQRAYEGRPSPCRFFPSCSEYSREAIETHGSGHGLWLTVRRMARCRPFGPSGFDPVPPARTQHGCSATTPGLES
jgi:putative membrane protein insertion efficiency factor